MRALSALVLAVALALPGAGARAQAIGVEAASSDAMAVPVWNSSNGKLEAVLWIDTSTLDASGSTRALGTRWTSANGRVTGSVVAAVEPQLGLLCADSDGGFDRLGDGCLVTQVARPAAPATGLLAGQVGTRIGRSEWTAFGSARRASTDGLLPGTSLSLHTPELSPLAGLPGLGFERNDLGILGELRLGQQGWISVGGSVARARLMPASSVLPGSVAPRWNSRTLSVGGGYGALGGEVVGRVVRVPGEAETYGTLGLGLTWRTPWAGRLTVGAQNLLSTGDNPVLPRDAAEPRDEGRVPYVRFQQDL
ncbi:MAG TPA: hypothetical protein DCM32_06360 [Xanthomonadaceae bacterium]|jgi:hypothetical protein|nr:hypothetical protein [Xanthomonadaceae bacterium]